MGQRLIRGAAQFERPRLRQAAVRARGRGLVEQVPGQLAIGAAAEVVAIFRPEPLARLRIPIVHEGRVLAAVDGPEKGVVNRLAAQRRGAVGGDENAGGAVFVLGRVVHDRDVEQRHAFDVQDRVAQQRVVIDVEHDRIGVQVPARRRLDAGREAAIGDLVFLGADLFDDVAEEVDVGVGGVERRGERARRRRPPRRLDVGDAAGVVERAEPGLGVEIGPVGGDAIVALRQQHVTRGDGTILIDEHLDVVGVEFGVLLVVQFDAAAQLPMVLVDPLARVAGRVEAGQRRLCGGMGGEQDARHQATQMRNKSWHASELRGGTAGSAITTSRDAS